MNAINKTNNNRILLILVFVVATMFAAAYASVPLYQLFCQVTGYGGTTQVAQEGEEITPINRNITIRFNADTNSELPWTFTPPRSEVTIKVGESKLIAYHAVNNSDEAIVGTAVYNVTPPKAGQYFVKQECFCFSRQELAAGAEATLPVSFYIDPSIDEDSDLDDVNTITLSYTFFTSNEEEE